MSMVMAYHFRALCFGRPCGPWRVSLREVREDLAAQGLGSYDEWRCFYVTVPGGIEQVGEWIEYETYIANGRRAA